MIESDKSSLAIMKKIMAPKTLFFLSFCVVLLLGLFYLHATWKGKMKENTQRAINLAMSAEAGFPKKNLITLKATVQDVGKPEYTEIKNSLMQIVRINPDVRFAYIFVHKEEKIVFLADSEPVDSLDYSPPGQEYIEASDIEREPFVNGKTVITKPMPDRWGTWVSVLVPMKDPDTGKVMALFGIDYPAESWYDDALLHTMQAGFVFLCVLLLHLTFYRFYLKNKMLRDERNKLSFANGELIKTRNSLKIAQSIAHVGNWEIDLAAKEVFASDEAFKIYGFKQGTLSLAIDTIQRIAYKEDRPKLDYALKNLLDNNENYDIEYRICSAYDGKEKVIHSNAIVERDENDIPVKVIGIIQDITERKWIEADLKESEERFRTIFEQSPIGIGIADTETGQIFQTNHRFTEIIGRSAEEIESLDWMRITHPDDLAEDLAQTNLLKQGKIESFKMNKRYVRPDGFIVWVNMTVASLRSSFFEQPMHICMIEDISERILAEEALRESERSKAMLLSNLYGMAYRCNFDHDYTMQFVSEGCYELTGYKPDDLLGNGIITFNNLIVQQFREPIWEKWISTLKAKTKFREEYQIFTAAGETKWVWEQGQGVYDASDNVVAIEGFILDINDRKKHEEDILHMNHHDVLTGLYNRTYFNESLQQLDTQSQLPLTLIVGDVNGLKLINDTFGHAAGDKVLIEIARTLRSCSQNSDIVCRTGGDEFCILLPKTSNEEAQALCRNIYDSCKKYDDETNKEIFYLSISLGFATKTEVQQSIDRLFKDAEEFMYKRKLMESKSMHSSILSSIKTTMFEKSHETEAHAERLVALSTMLGRALKLTDEQLFELELLATLHDIGKMSIDDHILNKPGKLTEEEWCEMRKHPAVGYRIAHASPELMYIADYILSHHERWDGNGYPQGLKGDAIPLLSRIVAIVDAFDAMTADRPYRKAMRKEDAIVEIAKNAGTQFDPMIVKIFMDLMKSSSVIETP